jgi:hypothetical protein
MQKKMINDAVAYIRSLAELRKRNADWVERAVREAISLSANKALENDVINTVASDVDQLIQIASANPIAIEDHLINIDAMIGMSAEALEDFHRAASQLAQTTLRSVLGQHELGQILASREQLNESIQGVLDKKTGEWGSGYQGLQCRDQACRPR